MGRIFRSFSVVTVALTVSLAAGATSQAGVIPWLYDAIFGPVPYGGAYYGSPYNGASYGGAYYRGYAGYGPMVPMRSVAGSSGCSPCSSGYAGAMPSSCGPAGCSSQVSFYSPCGPAGCSTSACNTSKTDWKSEKVTVAQPVPDKTPTPKTFVVDETKTSVIEQANAVVEKPSANQQTVTAKTGDPELPAAEAAGDEADPFKGPITGGGTINVEAADGKSLQSPTGAETGSGTGAVENRGNAGFGATQRGTGLLDDSEFKLPNDSASPALPEVDGTGTSGPNGDNGKPQPLNLDLKQGWKVKTSPERLTLRAGFRGAQIVRQTVPVPDDYRIRKPADTKIAGR